MIKKTNNSVIYFLLFIFFIVLGETLAIGKYRNLEFIEACSRKNPELESCLARSANVLTHRFRNGKYLFLIYY